MKKTKQGVLLSQAEWDDIQRQQQHVMGRVSKLESEMRRIDRLIEPDMSDSKVRVMHTLINIALMDRTK